MPRDTGTTSSVWTDIQPPQLEPLTADQTCDVCVIGAGIAGLSTAYMLSNSGADVVVLEDGSVGGGETGRTTAHLTHALDDRYFKLEKIRGRDIARRAAQSHTEAISKIESIVGSEGIDCDFERLDGFLFVPPKRSTRVLKRELDACHRVGLTEVALVDKGPLESFDTGPCLRFPRQAQFHPMKYLDGLVAAIRRNGSHLFTEAHVTDVKGGSPTRVETQKGQIVRARAVVVATNTPITDVVSIHTKQFPYRTYAIGATVPSGSIPHALLWDTLDPYHYVRVQSGEGRDILIVGGEDHKTGQENDGAERFARLERWTRERFPQVGEVDFRWSGQVMEPIDGIAFIGRNPLDEDNVFIATGDSGQGMTHGTIAGILLTDLLQGRKNRWEDLYSPSRITLRALGEFAGENINVAGQFTDYLTAGEIKSVDELKPGCGAIMREGLSKLAVYRDEGGVVHKLSAVCPHLGCLVAWNSTEKTWDCPCHGSKYRADGRVYQGPANSDLSEA